MRVTAKRLCHSRILPRPRPRRLLLPLPSSPSSSSVAASPSSPLLASWLAGLRCLLFPLFSPFLFVSPFCKGCAGACAVFFFFSFPPFLLFRWPASAAYFFFFSSSSSCLLLLLLSARVTEGVPINNTHSLSSSSCLLLLFHLVRPAHRRHL